jgi:hypothetical protein
MFDPASIGAALSSAKTIIDLVKNANDGQLAIRVSSAVAEVQGRLIEVQQQALDLQQENDKLRADIEKSRNYVQHHSAIWKIRPDGTEDGPFCPHCVGEGREMRLVLWNQADQTRTYWLTHCPKTHIDSRDKKPQGWMPASQEQTYVIPKDLVPENYFFHRHAGSL